MNRVKTGALFLAVMTSLVGCGTAEDFFISTTNFSQDNATRELDELIEQRDKLLPKYEKAVKRYEQSIGDYKEATRSNLKRGNLPKAYENLVTLYELTHPCGEDDCGTYPCEICLNTERVELSLDELNTNEIMLEREEIDNEDAFIMESSDAVFEMAGKYIAEKRYDEVNVVLEEFNPRVPLPSKNKDRFLKRQRNVKKTWLDVLVKEAKEVEAKHPATAALYFAKATELAKQIKDPDAGSLGEKAAELRARVVEERGYTILVGPVSGPASAELLKGITAETYPAEIRVVSSGERVTLSMSVNNPRYSRSKGKTTGSFRYVSGTKKVISGRWQNQHSRCQEARSRLSSANDFCNGTFDSRCDEVSSRQSDVSEECGALDGIQKMVDEDVFSDYTYPIRLHHLDTSIDLSFALQHADNRRSLTIPRVTDRLTDEEHGAYTAGISGKESGVRADPASPPSESRGYSSAKGVAISKGRSTVLKSFDGYREKLAKSSSDGGVVETDALATYIILRSDQVSDAIKERVKASSGVTNAFELIQSLDD